MKGQHKPEYRRPRTGEPRKVRQHFRINALPEEVRTRIKELRDEGKTWQEIENLSAEFSPTRLPLTTLHRWFDVNVEQPARRPEITDIDKLASLIANRVLEGLKNPLPEGMR
jgi:hypothetical protein